MLSANDLEYMRSGVEQLLPDTCTILALTITFDGQGAETITWGTASAGIACRLDASNKEMREGQGGEALLPWSQWILTLPHDTSITTAQRVVCNGTTFNVVGVDDEKSWNACVRVRLDKVE